MTTPDSASNPPLGTLAHVTALLSSVGAYLKARAALAMVEAREAGIQYGVALGLVVAAFALIFVGYFFLIITAVFGVALFFDNPHAWIAVLGIAALLHIAGAVMLFYVARMRVEAPAFQTTREELKNDQTWLTTSPNKS